MLKRPQYIILAVVVAVALVILNLPSHTAARLKLGIGSLFLALFGLSAAGQETTAKAADALTSRAELARQNEALRRENAQLRVQSTQAAAVLQENDRLRQNLGWQQRHRQWKPKLARVILRDPANWWRTVQIDLGSRDGVRENLPVLAGDCLVGRTAAVSLMRSQVVLLGDPNCKVAAVVQNETRDSGVIGSGGPVDTSFVTLHCYSQSPNLKAGQSVLTSGVGLIFPAGIRIGKIVDSRPVQSGLDTEARVKLDANLSALEEVWVLMP